MEYALEDTGAIQGNGRPTTVLILVLMEYALEDAHFPTFPRSESLNPCFNGICSRRSERQSTGRMPTAVLILVLMEYALEA